MEMKTSDAMIELNKLGVELNRCMDDTVKALPAPMIDLPGHSFSVLFSI